MPVLILKRPRVEVGMRAGARHLTRGEWWPSPGKRSSGFWLTVSVSPDPPPLFMCQQVGLDVLTCQPSGVVRAASAAEGDCGCPSGNL